MIKNLIKNAPATLITLSMLKHFCRNCSFILQRFAMMEPARERAEVCSGFSKASEIDQKIQGTHWHTYSFKEGGGDSEGRVFQTRLLVSQILYSQYLSKSTKIHNYILGYFFNGLGQLGDFESFWAN